ncbi:MAG: hypothetical protein KJP25_13105 [Gammaproteobacteria bacterium]|nr:hypothetical protein [Gammaproteobacteria bacterium]NND39125.1 hypothetical protein [Pseudomonadales bacterium]MBT8151818.1 hypothetical protein [Gammaproteobacteria bacterium]NNL11175.1 hypothetical protein [Pseudomonadales bacterium]NNM10556.1 hypothetical protein [Pseudomonadales bacterium]
MPDAKAHHLPLDQLDSYFAELQRCGGVAPAKRYRLEGFLQCLLQTRQVSEVALRSDIAARIKAFNRKGQVVLATPDNPWQLPYTAPLAPVNKTRKE